MKTKSLVYVFLVFFMFQACKKKSVADFNSNFSIFKEQISSFTSGIITAQSDIRVMLAVNKKDWKVNQVLDDDLFDISPSVAGKVVALSENTVAFIPEKKLKSDTEYKVTFKLSKVLNVKTELEDFKFTVKTIKQDFLVTTNDIQSYSKEYQYLNCVIKFADNIDFEDAKKLVEAEQEGNDLKIKFDKSQTSKTEFKFVIDSIQRMDSESIVEIKYDGDDCDIDRKDKIDYKIAAKNDFKVMNVEVPEGNIQSLFVNFSEPLEKNQNFAGLVNIQNTSNLKFSTQGNLLKVYFNNEPTTTEATPAVIDAVADATVADSAVVVDSTAAVVVDATAVVVDATAVAVDTTAVAIVEPVFVEAVVEEPTEAEKVLSGELLLEVFQGIESEYGQKMKQD